jgi:8-oxo-dGTP pyrophosphatase MutT (NUDIX family)
MNYSAGVLPVTNVRGETLVLLGRHRADLNLSDFGGRSEPEDLDDPKATARQEMLEETNGAVVDWDDTTRRLEDDRCHMLVRSVTMGHQLYYQYIMSVPYFSNYSHVFNKTNRFLWFIDAKRKYLEKDAISWYYLSEVIEAATSSSGSRAFRGADRSGGALRLRDVFAATIRNCIPQLLEAASLERYPRRRVDLPSPYGSAVYSEKTSPRAIPASTARSDPGSPSCVGNEEDSGSWAVSL